jgi:hypothetical protein
MLRAMHPRRALAALLAVLVLGCASANVSSDWDPQVDFSGLKTWDWFPRARPQTLDPRLDSGLLDARIRQAVEAELAAKGYKPRGGPNADFFVSHTVAIQQKISASSINDFYGPSYGVSRVYVDEYEEGTLVIDVLDPRKQQVIWRGSYQARLTPASNPSQREERVNTAVHAVLERFPPPAAATP